MDLLYTDEQLMFRDTLTRFAETELAPDRVARANADGFDAATKAKLVEMGLMGIMMPEEDGGQGGSLMDAVIAIRAVALSCPRSADVVQAGNFGAIRTFSEFATPAQKERWLPGLLSGETLMSVGMSEPEAGSAVTELTTTATPDGDGYRLNGTKVFGTHSGTADLILCYCRFGPGVSGIGSVMLERGTDGFTAGPPIRYMNGESWSQLYFDNVYVPPENVLLGPGGFKKQISGFNVERLGNSSRAVSVGRLAFNVAREHALERRQFGRPLAEFQGIQWKFAEMAVKLDAAELLLERAVVNAGDGLPSGYDTAMAKLACNEAGHFAADQALQVMGALGFGEDHIVQYCLRRTRGWMIAGGTTEILKNRVAEEVFGRRFSQRPPKARAGA
ncbi:acyl-CoA dehydrogenase [Acuticoccus sediminis]|uniref:Acyl-CoA dehydrogenase n=1 Tax=Acuticoccus sediminis TaxID=2184697 RepID=A0A8B2NZA7_9HYPH|nr:acyl-CoA dehydrogenase [Acuticoccus sediminis]RAI01890.1 acyl-CoA dehydrogenase [Acuticoccus sediminis]